MQEDEQSLFEIEENILENFYKEQVDKLIQDKKRQKEKEGETLKIKGTGKGTITVVFDNDTVMRRNVDFETGELS